MTTFTTEDREKAEQLKNILDGEKVNTDDTTGYEESTHEKQQEWAKNRNDPWDEWKANKDIV